MNEKGKIILSWWRTNLDRETPRGRALGARLRRADPVEILCEPELHELSEDLKLRDAGQLVRIAAVLAEVRTHIGPTLARVLGGREPILSPLRFRRLMSASEDELPAQLRRAVAMAGGACNVAALGNDLLFWNEGSRVKWCFDYYGAEAPEKISEEISE